MFPLPLYLLHHVHLHSHLLSPSTATVHPAFSQVNLSWVMKPNLLLSLGTLLLSPFPMFFFLLKNGESFSSFQSLLPHATQVFHTFLTSFPLCHCSLSDHHSLTSPISVYWSGLLSFAASYRDWGYTLEYVTFSWWLHPIPQFFGISSPAACLGCGSSRATLCFPALPCSMSALQDSPSAVTDKSRTKFKRSEANLLSYPLSNF